MTPAINSIRHGDEVIIRARSAPARVGDPVDQIRLEVLGISSRIGAGQKWRVLDAESVSLVLTEVPSEPTPLRAA